MQLKAIAARKAGMSVAFWKFYDAVRLGSGFSIQGTYILVEYRDMPDRRQRRENLAQHQSRSLLLHLNIKNLFLALANTITYERRAFVPY